MTAGRTVGAPVSLRDLVNAMRELDRAVHLRGAEPVQVPDARGAALAVLSADGVVLCANRRVAALLGQECGELTGRWLVDFAPSQERTALQAQLSAPALNEYRAIDALLIGRTGRPVEMTLHQHAISGVAIANRSRLTLFCEPIVMVARSPANYDPSDSSYRSAALLQLGQHTERQRLAADLHDGLGQDLTLIKLMVEDARIRLGGGRTDEAVQLLDTAVKQVRDTMDEMRRICGELRPLALDRLGLPAALSTLCQRFAHGTQSLTIRFRCNVEDNDIPAPLKTDIFRIVQEALNNILKHASATEAELELRLSGNTLHLSVSDNGSGYLTRPMHPDEIGASGFGLVDMQHRVEAQGGHFSIDSSELNGTLLVATWVL
ncbi:histidine kinase [Paraburkholderia dinghuensis]|uniref:PAS domain-containing sensor histidine kinase n=1 Tax=Paraburkholderia dinghuensis TaxID=2305225 RepID=A0A3N6MNK3_9BURK|nr:histidine kinase [Paraburkholderia dinghuensis]RQH05474.1 PAS domain-containing sensor histidine kinase [Paraburkholderia dinghuensis]